MVTRTEAIAAMLKLSTHPELAELYNYNMEVQVNVSRGIGERVGGEYRGITWTGWSDGVETWKALRIPYSAKKDPHYEDKDMKFDLANHAESIGMTGWDWRNQLSLWVAFDFDAITGHSDAHAHKLTQAELNEIQSTVESIDWVTIRKSTGSKGLHLYVFLDPVKCENHTEHAALARAILGKLSALTGYNFQSKVDICGGNMWIWHKKMRGNDESLKLIKQGEILSDIPPNWRDHIKVINNAGRKVPKVIEDNASGDPFIDLVTRNIQVQLGDVHRSHVEWLQQHECVWWWDQDNHMLVTHTIHLKQMHEDMCLRGVFDTSTSHSSPQNCFCFPLRDGSWVVRRYSLGVIEHTSWEQDGAGWTRCYLNRQPTFETACRAQGSLEDTNGEFVFTEAAVASEALKQLDIFVELPADMRSRYTWLKRHKDGRIIAMIERTNKEMDSGVQVEGWLSKKDKFIKIFGYRKDQQKEPESNSYDHFVRHLVSQAKDDAGWVLHDGDDWTFEPLTHISLALGSLGLKGAELIHIKGAAIMNPWRIVNKPFQDEYPGDRQWNLQAARLKYKPLDEPTGVYPTWNKILMHCGSGIDSDVAADQWCRINGLKTGGDYLKCWVASLFQYPERHLPYLFFYSPITQKTGKTSFYESLSLLFTSGYIKAATALQSKDGFNKELQGAVLCVIEEVDLSSTRKQAYDRVKDWTTARELCIHPKGKTPFHTTNTTHWVQCANDQKYCPVFKGDTRITIIKVPPIHAMDIIPTREFDTQLIDEAPAFLAEILNMELPYTDDRLGIPCLETRDKTILQRVNESDLSTFISDNLVPCSGNRIAFGEFRARFYEAGNSEEEWSRIRLAKEVIGKITKGKSTSHSGAIYLADVRWIEDTVELKDYHWELRNDQWLEKIPNEVKK